VTRCYIVDGTYAIPKGSFVVIMEVNRRRFHPQYLVKWAGCECWLWAHSRDLGTVKEAK